MLQHTNRMSTDGVVHLARFILSPPEKHTDAQARSRQEELPQEFQHLIQQFQSDSKTQQALQTQRPSLQAKCTSDGFIEPTLENQVLPSSPLHSRHTTVAKADKRQSRVRPAKEQGSETAPYKRRKVNTDNPSCLLEDIKRWIRSPNDFFAAKGPESHDISDICRYVTQVEKCQNLGVMQLRFALRSLYLSKLSWKGFRGCNLRKKLADIGATVAESTLRAWVKEGCFYDQLCRKFGPHALFFDISNRKEIQRMTLDKNSSPGDNMDAAKGYERAFKLYISHLKNPDAGLTEDERSLWKNAAEAIAQCLHDKQIRAGINRAHEPFPGESGGQRTRTIDGLSEESPDSLAHNQSENAVVAGCAIQQQRHNNMPIPKNDMYHADIHSSQLPILVIPADDNYDQPSSQAVSQGSAARPSPGNPMALHSATTSTLPSNAHQFCLVDSLYRRPYSPSVALSQDSQLVQSGNRFSHSQNIADGLGVMQQPVNLNLSEHFSYFHGSAVIPDSHCALNLQQVDGQEGGSKHCNMVKFLDFNFDFDWNVV